MISLSQEWTLLSRQMYGEDFIDELADLLEGNNIETVLECGCGDGNILQGLARRGFSCLGIDGSQEMIQLAVSNSRHPNVRYEYLNWLNLSALDGQFDSVICRGNSLSSVVSWEKDFREFDSSKAREAIEKSIDFMLCKVNDGGLFYVDTVSQDEIDKGEEIFEIKNETVNVKGLVLHDRINRTRYVFGGGRVEGETYFGGSATYLLSPNELEKMIIESDSVSRIWSPDLEYENYYQSTCACKT